MTTMSNVAAIILISVVLLSAKAPVSPLLNLSLFSASETMLHHRSLPTRIVGVFIRNPRTHPRFSTRLLGRTFCYTDKTPQPPSPTRLEPASNLPPILRLVNIHVPYTHDPGKEHTQVHQSLQREVRKRLKLPRSYPMPEECIKIVRKSFDARRRGGRGRNEQESEPAFVYIIDVNTTSLLRAGESNRKTRVAAELFKERLSKLIQTNAIQIPESRSLAIQHNPQPSKASPLTLTEGTGQTAQPRRKQVTITVIGSGPAGLFAALTLVEGWEVSKEKSGEFGRFPPVRVQIVERGRDVGQRGKDIGALINRRVLSKDSNLCFGEGGAGTWSDGKLATNIGRNSEYVRFVFERLVESGAPERILVDGKPHLGTDRLVQILKKFRERLEATDRVSFHFGQRITDIRTDGNKVIGVDMQDIDTGKCEYLQSDKVVVAAGHSAREIYEILEGIHAELEPKEFAAGFRVEHPQELINIAQYKEFAKDSGPRKDNKIPVADYKLALKDPPVYSFCMCPGGQIVPTSIVPSELCINGMSFSRRQSRFANAAIVTTIPVDTFGDAHTAMSSEIERVFGPYELKKIKKKSGKMSATAGMRWQQEMERGAAIAGGGKLVCPAQRLIHFLDDTFDPDDILPASSYRMGVKNFPIRDLYPPAVINRIRESLSEFEKKLPGFISQQAVLHGVETRTSSSIRIKRDPNLCSVEPYRDTLYAAGEGAGYAGGIVSAAVDGVRVAESILREL
mmetsp:Transcript_16620/g.26349  ORF Transcript_16620/g.26349 Transcript_16620/m.26349 type:complete len:736 (-) Transcript_16620:123-2330(-)